MDQGIQTKDPGGRDGGGNECGMAGKLCSFVLDIPDAYWV